MAGRRARQTKRKAQSRAPTAKRRRAPVAEYREVFDAPVKDRWTSAGNIRAHREPATSGPGERGPSGYVLHVVAGPSTTVQTAPLSPRPRFETCEALRLRVYAPQATSRTPLVFEAQAYCGGRRAWWWRRVALEKPTWVDVELPLRWFRAGTEGFPSWEEVNRIGLWFRGGGELLVDEIEATRGRRADAAYLPLTELATVAFGRRSAIIRRRKPFAVLTDADDFDIDAVLAALTKVARALRRDLPTLLPPTRHVPILVFRRQRDARDFWPRFLRKFGSSMPAQTDVSIQAMGVAATVRRKAVDVPAVLVTHGAIALLEHTTGIPNEGGWLHVGLANRHRLGVTGEDVSSAVRAGLRSPTKRLPLARLVSGERLPDGLAWQALAYVDWLLDDDRRRRGFLSALTAMRSAGTGDLRPLVTEHLGAGVDALERAWLDWAAGRYG